MLQDFAYRSNCQDVLVRGADVVVVHGLLLVHVFVRTGEINRNDKRDLESGRDVVQEAVASFKLHFLQNQLPVEHLL